MIGIQLSAILSRMMVKEKKLLEVIQERFDDFCQLCSLHGLIYLRGDVKLPVCDRVFWMTIFVSSMVVSCVVIHNVWVDWSHNPIVIVYDSNVRPIWDIPFPSITVCSLVPVKRSVLDLETSKDRKGLFFSSLVCSSKEMFKNKSLRATPEEMKTFNSFLNEASPTCEEMLKRCTWQNVDFPCCTIFHPIVTNGGLCFVANSLPSSVLFTSSIDKQFLFNNSYPAGTRFWTPEGGYPHPDKRGIVGDKTGPKWATSTGYESGFSIEVEQNMDEWQDICSGGYSGFKVLLNSPEEAPVSSHAALRAPMHRDFIVKLAPQTISTEPDLISTSPPLRGCLFQGEKRLDFFGTYTQTNCILECLLEESLYECGCVPFYMPRNASVPVCSKDTDQKCIQKVEDQLVANSIDQSEELSDEDLSTPWCGCYPSCNEVTYNYISNHGLFFKGNTSKSHGFARISVFYPDRHFLGVHRQVRTTFYDFLGTCGGLLGLFMGFSCISLVEVAYHVILRPLGCLAVGHHKAPATDSLSPSHKPTTIADRRGRHFDKTYYN